MAHLQSSSLGFRSLLATQFLGALNDNLFKLILTLYVAQKFVDGSSGIGHLILVSVVFVSPYILCSSIAGWLADRYSKSKVVQALKALEVLIMAVALLFLLREHVPWLLGLLFMLGIQSALFSPSKYGLLPELLDPEELSKGNGLIEFVTFAGIIAGTALGGLVIALFGTASYATGLILVAIAVLGTITSFGIPQTPTGDAATPITINPFHCVKGLRELRGQRALFLTVLAIAYFWAIASMYQLNLVLYGKTMLAVSDLKISLQLAVLGIGIGIGSVVAGKVSEGKVELGLVPLGALGIALSSVLLAFSYHSYWISLLLLGVMGFCSGFYSVPLNAFLQESSPDDRRGQYIAASNFLSFCSMLVFSFLLLGIVDGIGLNPAQVFLVFGLCSIAVAVYICAILPEVLIRCINWCLIHVFYRVTVVGSESVPERGGALLVCNHVSMLDACIVLASLRRPVRFLMFRPIYEAKFINPVAKIMGAIPVQGGSSKEDIENSLQLATEAVRAGEVVCIFAEGAITRTGHMLKFKRGFERIMTGVDAPIVPVHLDQMWGSIFSYKHGKFFWKSPKTIPYPITVSFGKPLPPATKSAELRQVIQELSCEAFLRRPTIQNSISETFLRTAKARGTRVCARDFGGTKLSWWQALTHVLTTLEALRNVAPPAPKSRVAVVLTPSVELGLLNAALLCNGQVPVNIAPDSAVADIAHRISQAGVSQIIAPQDFFARLGADAFAAKVTRIEVEQLRKQKSILSWIAARFFPIAVLRRVYTIAQVSADDSAAVVFSRGVTGSPKAVVLSHSNIISNVSALQELFTFDDDDCVLGVLPCDHAFGLTATVWLPLLTGMTVVYAPVADRIDVVAHAAKRHRPTMLFSSTFLLEQLLKHTQPEDFSSVEFVFVGGDPLTGELRERFESAWKADLLEGYGAAELSPLAVINVPDARDQRETHVGNKAGSVGHPIPGVAVRVVDPQTNALQAVGTPGRLLVKGPNILKEYLDAGAVRPPELRDGWFDTGDIAQIDSDGFVTVVGRDT